MSERAALRVCSATLESCASEVRSTAPGSEVAEEMFGLADLLARAADAPSHEVSHHPSASFEPRLRLVVS